MMMRTRRSTRCTTVVLAAALAMLGLATTATAQEGEYERFEFCPYTNPEVFKCLYSVTEGGEVVLGKKKVPIVNPAVLQGGISEPDGELVSDFFGATNGVTLSKAPQPVPGGLLGLVPPESAPPLIKELLALATENGLTGVNSTLELARPASEIAVSELHIVFEEGVALKLPVKVKLENPLLGNNCYVGSSSSPIVWNLTTGETNPPPPNAPIHGSGGELIFKDEGLVLELLGSELVDNAWSAPQAQGCGGLLAPLIDPIINSQVGLPSAAGNNTAILETSTAVALAETVEEQLGE